MGTGCTNVQETYDYNNRLQPVRIQVGTASTPNADICLVYNYYAGVGNATSCTATPTQASTGNNGNTVGHFFQDNTSNHSSDTYTYTFDSLNRLSTATAKDLTPTTLWSQTYSYDPYGNMTCSGSGLCTGMTFDQTTNRVYSVGTTWAHYDAAGNLTTDPTSAPSRTYAWDAENRMTTVDTGSTASYSYNALGQRVQVVAGGNTYAYLFDPAGDELATCNGGSSNGCSLPSYVKMGGRALAYYDYYGGWFMHGNNVGTTVLETRHDGTIQSSAMYYPWGQLWGTGNYSLDDQHFAGMQERETFFAPNLDPTPFRKYNSSQGRWLSPDPLAVTLNAGLAPTATVWVAGWVLITGPGVATWIVNAT